MHTCVLVSLLHDKIPRQNQLNVEKVNFVSQF